jgi:hypothetical protein
LLVDIIYLILLLFVIPLMASFFINFSVFKVVDLFNSRKSVNN